MPVLGVARSADPLGGTTVGPDTAGRLARPTGGKPLAAGVRGQMESAFDADFGSVRVHEGADASALARDVSATAFTHGEHIYLGSGAQGAHTEAGQRLLAHELTHVVQARSTPAPASGGAPVIGRADDPSEVEADRVAGGVIAALRRQAGRHEGGQDA